MQTRSQQGQMLEKGLLQLLLSMFEVNFKGISSRENSNNKD